MKSQNLVILLGNVGTEPDFRYTPSGTPVISFSLATSTRWKQGDEEKERTDWHRCVAWSKTAEIINEYVHKASRVSIIGNLRVSDWEDKDGNKRTKVEVIVDDITFLSAPQSNGGAKKSETRETADIPF